VQDDHCPRCGKTAVVTGGMEERVGFFLPDGLRWWKRLCALEDRESILSQTRGRFRACTDCGLVWSQLCPQQLQQNLNREAPRPADREGLLEPDPAAGKVRPA